MGSEPLNDVPPAGSFDKLPSTPVPTMDGQTMPRKPRLFLPGYPAHVIQRGNNKKAVFFNESDRLRYLSLLAEAGDRFGVEIHTYVLMTNHVHLLMTPSERSSISLLMQFIGRRYVPYINKKYLRSGTLWEGRFKANTIESGNYLLACYRYIELNPVRAGMVESPWAYRWSGSRTNALGAVDDLLTPHPEYLALDSTKAGRALRYRQLFDSSFSDTLLSNIRLHLQSGTPLGSDRFKQLVESQLGMAVGKTGPGRPRLLGQVGEKGF